MALRKELCVYDGEQGQPLLSAFSLIRSQRHSGSKDLGVTDQQVIAERRRADRHSLKIALRLGNCASSGLDQIGQSIDISATGAFLETDLSFQVGSPIDLHLQLPHEITGQPTMEWHCRGRVIRVTSHPASRCLSRVGMRFDWLNASRVRVPRIDLQGDLFV
jgi:hypothetical protein